MKSLPAFFSLAALSALLSSCSSSSNTPPPQPVQLSGTVRSGSGSAAVSLAGQSGALASANTDAGGRFTLTLPDAARLAGQLVAVSDVLTDVGCTGQLNSSNASAHGFGFAALDLTRGESTQQIYAASAQGHVLSLSSELNLELWVYSDQATDISGKIDCTKLADSSQVSRISTRMANNNNAAVNLKPGWNNLHFHGTSGTSAPFKIDGRIFNSTSAPGSDWRTFDDVVKALKIGL